MSAELSINKEAGGKDGLVGIVEKVLKYSVNTWDQGFMDKLYASTNAVSISPCWLWGLGWRGALDEGK